MSEKIVYADNITAGYTIYGNYPVDCGYEDELEIWWWDADECCFQLRLSLPMLSCIVWIVELNNHPEIWHVDDVYHPENGNYPYVHIWDGTHTVDEWWHLEDLQACFEPAGWSTSIKPTYILTRKIGHKAYPKDLMSPTLYSHD